MKIHSREDARLGTFAALAKNWEEHKTKVEEILRDDPNITFEDAIDQFRKWMRKDLLRLVEGLEFYFVNNTLRNIQRIEENTVDAPAQPASTYSEFENQISERVARAEQAPPPPRQSAEDRAKTDAYVKRKAAEIQERMMMQVLQLIMPNGKAMRFCTFGEMGQFSDRYAKLSKMGKSWEIVGTKIDEDQARVAIFPGYKRRAA